MQSKNCPSSHPPSASHAPMPHVSAVVSMASVPSSPSMRFSSSGIVPSSARARARGREEREDRRGARGLGKGGRRERGKDVSGVA
eukprot:285529-Rhodomonas_salina.1